MNWKERVLGVSAKNPHLQFSIAAVFVAGFLAYYWDQAGSPEQIQAAESVEVSTLIPSGYVLVPIEVANYESLDSILGNFGLVDLYLPADDSRKRPIKIAERIKILRAPLNPSRFAVLAREEESARIVTHAGHLHVVIQNPDHSGTRIEDKDEAEAGEDGPAGKGSESESSKTKGRRTKKRSRIFVETVHVEAL